MRPIPREVKESAKKKWYEAMFVGKEEMEDWWIDIGDRHCSLCEHDKKTGYCALKDSICKDEFGGQYCIDKLRDVFQAIKNGDHPAYLIACGVMLGLIRAIPVIEDEEKESQYKVGERLMWDGYVTFNDGQRKKSEKKIVTITDAEYELNSASVENKGIGWTLGDNQLRPLTDAEKDHTVPLVDNIEDFIRGMKPKQPVFEEDDVVIRDGKIGVLKYNTGDGHKWKIILNGNENDFYFVNDCDIRHLTEKEWINEVVGYRFKARIDSYNHLMIKKHDESIVRDTSESQLNLNHDFDQAIIKALKLKVMPFKQWKRMREE